MLSYSWRLPPASVLALWADVGCDGAGRHKQEPTHPSGSLRMQSATGFGGCRRLELDSGHHRAAPGHRDYGRLPQGGYRIHMPQEHKRKVCVRTPAMVALLTYAIVARNRVVNRKADYEYRLCTMAT